MRHAEQVADDLDRNGGGKTLDQVGAPLHGHRVQQSVDQRDEAGFHPGDDAVRQRHLDRAAHMGVQRRIVEHETGGVMGKQRRIAVFRAELDLLVGGEHARIAVDRVAIAPARDQVGAVRHAMHRVVLTQRAVVRERIVDEVRRQALEVEIADLIARHFDGVCDDVHGIPPPTEHRNSALPSRNLRCEPCRVGSQSRGENADGQGRFDRA
jgi:hypothetical protein